MFNDTCCPNSETSSGGQTTCFRTLLSLLFGKCRKSFEGSLPRMEDGLAFEGLAGAWQRICGRKRRLILARDVGTKFILGE